MCVEIIKEDSIVSFKPELPFDEQMVGSSEVVIDCEPDCPKVVKFLDEMEKACKCGKSIYVQIKTLSNDLGLYRKTIKLNKDLAINDIVSRAVQLYKKTDDELEKITSMCMKERDGR